MNHLVKIKSVTYLTGAKSFSTKRIVTKTLRAKPKALKLGMPIIGESKYVTEKAILAIKNQEAIVINCICVNLSP